MKKKNLLIIIAIIVIAAVFLIPGGDSGTGESFNIGAELNLIEETPLPEAEIANNDPESENPQIMPEAPPQESQEEPVIAEDEPAQPAQEVQEEPVSEIQEEPAQEPEEPEEPAIDEDGWYDSKEEVALYIHTYGRLPDNYISKKEAEKLGWNGGGLDRYAPGKSIGGSHFGNYEGLLPEGHNYTECDIDTAGKGSRGAKRIVFSDDGLIYYTDDHYESFTLLYGNED